MENIYIYITSLKHQMSSYVFTAKGRTRITFTRSAQYLLKI